MPEIFCNIIHDITVTYDQFNVSMLNKNIHFFKNLTDQPADNGFWIFRKYVLQIQNNFWLFYTYCNCKHDIIHVEDKMEK